MNEDLIYGILDKSDILKDEEGHKSVAFSLVFRSPERSLEAAEINKIVDKILKELEKMGVELRA